VLFRHWPSKKLTVAKMTSKGYLHMYTYQTSKGLIDSMSVYANVS